jgi:drug/metabolite transporter (DMT)-like permease
VLRIGLAYAAVCIIWGSTYLAIRISLESYPPFLIGAARFLGAGAVLFILARVRREPLPTPVEWRSAVITGAVLLVIGNGFVNLAERSVSSGVASVLVATMPLWTTVLSRAFGQPVSSGERAGVVLGLIGVVVLNLGGELRASSGGAALSLLAAMGWALGSLASQRLPLPAGIMRSATQMLGGGAAMLLVSLARGERLAPVPTLRSGLATLYLFVFGSLIAFSAYSYLLKHTRPALATSYAYVNPVVAVVLGVVFAGEHFGAASLLGSTIVLAAVLLVGATRLAA